MIKLRLPLEQIRVVQPFGVNYVNFYTQLGMRGHNGIDFESHIGFNCYAAHDGDVVFAGEDDGGGLCIQIVHPTEHFVTIYYHLSRINTAQGKKVRAGQYIGNTGNTGKYTTGPHLHFGLKELDLYNVNTWNYDNGYKGAINAAPYFCYTWNGRPIKNKDWSKSRSYHRYYRDAKRNLANEIKTATYMATVLKRLPTSEEVNMAIWGGWDMEAIKNPALYEITSQLTKAEYMNGERPFNS